MSRQQMRRLGHRRRGALLAAALLLAAPTIEAQIKPVKRNASMDWVVPYCAEAVASAKRGYGDSQFGESLARLQGCGTDGADAAAAALRSLRSVSDTTVLDSLTLNFQAWRDAVLFDAGLRLARNASATPESRVFAIRYLYSTLKPQAGSLFYGELTRGCNLSGGSSVGFGGGRLLASNYPDILRRLGNQLADSAAIPGPVRAAAFCLATIPKGLAAPEPPAPPTGPATGSTITGTVYIDLDWNGVPAPDEPRLSTWTVQLLVDGAVARATLTNAGGTYTFTNVAAGNYTVCVTLKSGFGQSSPSGGPSCPNGNGYSANVSTSYTGTWSGFDFGYYDLASP